MLTLYLSYNHNSEELLKDLKELNINLISYSEDSLSSRSKSFRLKGSYSARELPFAVLLDSNKHPIKAFYSEANECTLDNIKSLIQKFPNHESTSN